MFLRKLVGMAGARVQAVCDGAKTERIPGKILDLSPQELAFGNMDELTTDDTLKHIISSRHSNSKKAVRFSDSLATTIILNRDSEDFIDKESLFWTNDDVINSRREAAAESVIHMDLHKTITAASEIRNSEASGRIRFSLAEFNSNVNKTVQNSEGNTDMVTKSKAIFLSSRLSNLLNFISIRRCTVSPDSASVRTTMSKSDIELNPSSKISGKTVNNCDCNYLYTDGNLLRQFNRSYRMSANNNQILI